LFIISLIVAEALTILFAVPTFLLLRRRLRITFIVCLAAGY
jgi:hypothetical protein